MVAHTVKTATDPSDGYGRIGVHVEFTQLAGLTLWVWDCPAFVIMHSDGSTPRLTAHTTGEQRSEGKQPKQLL